MTEKNNPEEREELKSEQKPQKLNLKNIFYHNTFVLVFSFICAVTIWFSMAAGNLLDRPWKVYDVPVEIQLSSAAQEDGIRVFSQTEKVATVAITGSNLVVNKVTAADLKVVAKLTPEKAKLVGNTMQTEVVPLTGMKQGNNLADYEVASVVPREISVTYDRYKEATFTIEKNIKYTTGDKYFIPTPNISETEVVVSGPESSVNKVSRVSLDYEIPDLITESKSFSCALTAYDQTNKPMKLSELFLTMSVDSVDVSLEVLSRQTVALDIPVLNVPEGYSASRITIEPKTIDIAGDYETVSKYKTLTLPNNIDFSKVNTKNFSFEMDIPMPAGVKNVSEVEKATITANLNGFQEQSFNVENLQMVNVPEKKSATLVTKSIQVDVVGSTAQISRLTPASISGTIDMAKMTDKSGNIEVPVTLSISGSTSCWIYGTYTVHVNVQGTQVVAMESLAPADPK